MGRRTCCRPGYERSTVALGMPHVRAPWAPTSRSSYAGIGLARAKGPRAAVGWLIFLVQRKSERAGAPRDDEEWWWGTARRAPPASMRHLPLPGAITRMRRRVEDRRKRSCTRGSSRSKLGPCAAGPAVCHGDILDGPRSIAGLAVDVYGLEGVGWLWT